MTSQVEQPIAPVIHMLADEIACVREMLLRYEIAISKMPTNADPSDPEIQGFDLALQMLKDLEHLSKVIGDHLPEGVVASKPMQTSGLVLERSRHRLNTSIGLQVTGLQPRPNSAVDLF